MTFRFMIRCDSCGREEEVDTGFVNQCYESLEETRCEKCNALGNWTVLCDQGTGKFEHIVMGSRTKNGK